MDAIWKGHRKVTVKEPKRPEWGDDRRVTPAEM